MKLNTKKSQNKNRIFRLAVMGVTVISISSIILLTSETANAGLLSFVDSILGSPKASAEIKHSLPSLNSQKINLLAASTNIKPNAELSSETMPIDEEMSLVPDIAANNSIHSDVGSSQISAYTVQKGDNLDGIAKMFNVSVNTIVWANDISRNTPLKEGQVLLILPVSGINYTVKSGDTIKGIVSKHKGDLEEVLRFNDLSLNSKLKIGQTIVIPNGEIGGSSVASNKSSGSLPAVSGFIRPIKIGVKSQGIHGKNAVDLAAPVGTPIYAAAGGTVIISKDNGWNGGYGTFVVISHPNGTQTLYSHMRETEVVAGQKVAQGQKVGEIGMTGITTGPHLHFEVRGAKNPF